MTRTKTRNLTSNLSGLAGFQPGVGCRPRPDLKPTVHDLLSGETEGADDLIDPTYFDALSGMQVYDYTWDGWKRPASLFPMVYSDMGMLSAAYTLSVEEAQAIPVMLDAPRALPLIRSE